MWVALLIGWIKISHPTRPIRSTTQIWVVTRHQYGISALVSQTSFGGETSGSVAKCRLFSQATSPPKQAICEFKVQNFYQVRISFLRISRRITFMRITYFPHFLLKNDAKGNSKIVYFVHVYALLTKAGWGQDAWIWAKFLLAFFLDPDERSIKTSLISSHLDLTSLVNKGFIIWPKRSAHLARSGSQSDQRIHFI